MTTLLEQLLEEPTQLETVATLSERLETERERRERFRDEVDPDQKAEFINGQVVILSPALNRHLVVTDRLFSMLQAFVMRLNLGHVVTEKARCGFPRNDYEPDVALFGLEQVATIDLDTGLFPVPDFIATPTGFDLRLKSGTGEVTSRAVPGFQIPIRSLFDVAEN
jgi:Uma2 family endonuclease